MNASEKYIKDVLSDKIVVGEYIKKAVQRHLSDLETGEERGMYFDKKHAEKVLEVFRAIPHSKGRWAGQNFTLQPWQAFILYCVYGWKWKESNTRRFNKVYVKVARKNGKTEFLAGVGVLGMTLDAVPGGEIYWAATKYAQAAIGWDRQRTMIELLMSKHKIFSQFGTNSKRIYNKKSKMFTRALGKDSKREDGLSPYYAFIDEYHAHIDTGLVDILESGMGAYKQPITWIITTAGFDSYCVCKDFEDKCKAILDGHATNDEVFSAIFEMDKGDDWQDVNNWVKANPSLGATNTLKAMQSEYQKAKLEGISKEISFRVKNLNEWHNQKETWIKPEIWAQNATEVNESDLLGRDCYVGFDLGVVSDATAIVLCFPLEDGQFYFKHEFFSPEDTAKIRSMDANVNYLQWHRDGWLNLTEGNVTDYRAIFNKILEIGKKYQIKMVAYDPYNTLPIIADLTDSGFECRPYSQGIRSMTTPAKQMETKLMQGKWKHDGNPMAAWMVSNVSLKTDSDGNIKPFKDKPHQKIDGVVAALMAFGAYLLTNAQREQTLPDDFEIVF